MKGLLEVSKYNNSNFGCSSEVKKIHRFCRERAKKIVLAGHAYDETVYKVFDKKNVGFP